MKVLHVINSLATGGAEKLLLDTIPKYNEQGIKTDIALLNATEYPFLTKLKKTKQCTIYSLSTAWVYNPFLIFKIIPYLKKYDIVHVHLFPALYWVVIAKIISFSNVKLIFTEHNTSNKRITNAFFRFFDRHIYKFYHTIVCITEKIQHNLIKYTGLPQKKFIIIKNGVDLTAIFQATPIKKTSIHKTLSNNDILVLQVSSFRTQKDQNTLIKSLSLLPKNIKLLLAGEGDLIQDSKKLTQELNLENRVLFLGNRTDIPQLLKSVDVVVLSSKYEGLSLSCIEGMASGKPFIASNVPGLKEVVKNAGVLFPQGDYKKLAKEINGLLNSTSYYENTVKSCVEKAKHYDLKNMVNLHIQLYKSLNP